MGQTLSLVKLEGVVAYQFSEAVPMTRPFLHGSRMAISTVRLDDETRLLLTLLGGGNLSRGIRLITAGRLGENGTGYFQAVAGRKG